jgi:universal stress protein E
VTGLLVVLDPDLEASQPSLEKAARLAGDEPVSVFVNVRSTSLEKRLTHGAEALEQARQNISESWRKQIGEMAERLAIQLGELRIVWSSDSFQDLMRTIEDWQPAMVVVHSHYEPRLKRLLFTPLEWKLLRNATCPLLFAGDQHWSEHPPVVAAVDPDPFAETPDALTRGIVEHGRRWSGCLGSGLTLVHALDYPDETLVMLAGEAIPASVDVAESQRELYEQRLEAIRQSEELREEQIQFLDGPPAQALADYMASLPPGLLVMGTVQKGSVERLLLGNTAEQILFRSASDVLVLHNPESAGTTP